MQTDYVKAALIDRWEQHICGGLKRSDVLAHFLSPFLVGTEGERTMGLASTGFPGTLGFVGQELFVDGAVDVFPVMGFAVVVASALTGVVVLRMYFSLFCGRLEIQVHPSLHAWVEAA